MAAQESNPIRLVVTAPDRTLVEEDVQEVILPTHDGYIGFLPGHFPLICVVGIGELTYYKDGIPHYLAVAGGFAEVLPDHIRVLPDAAELPERIDRERAERAIERAKQALARPDIGKRDRARAEEALARALNRIRIANRRAGV